jgi:hypothetical protein
MASDSSVNTTDTNRNPSVLLFKWVILMSFFCILCVTALVVNGFLLFVIWKDPKKCLRTRPTFLITNLITADFLGALGNISRFSYRYFVHEFGDDEPTAVFSRPVTTLGYVAVLVSYTTVFLISIEHLAAIASPLKFKVMATNRVIAWIIGLTWLFCVILTILLYTIPKNHQVFHAITAVHGLLLITLPTAYSFAYLSLKRQMEKLIDMASDSAVNVLKQKQMLQRKNFLVTSAGIVLFSLITCAPFTFHNYKHFINDIHYNHYRNSDKLGMIFWVILNLNLCADPFIYCLRIPQYRNSCAVFFRRSRVATIQRIS